MNVLHTIWLEQPTTWVIFFGDHIIAKNGPVYWPVRSPYLLLLDFYLWGYTNNEAGVRDAFRSINRNTLGRVTRKVLSKFQGYITNSRRHFEYKFVCEVIYFSIYYALITYFLDSAFVGLFIKWNLKFLYQTHKYHPNSSRTSTNSPMRWVF